VRIRCQISRATVTTVSPATDTTEQTSRTRTSTVGLSA
jgi:hypothetical protein